MIEFPYLLIIMRNDMRSMTPGRCAAQAAHASTAFSTRMEKIFENENTVAAGDQFDSYLDWRDSTTQNFGTTIVAQANLSTIEELEFLASKENLISAMIVDPTYPVRDGQTVHLVSVVTCSYIFITEAISDNLLKVLKELPLL